jgi:hypothetical protein
MTKPSTTTPTRELEPCPRGHTGAQVCNSNERMFYVTCVDYDCFWTLGEGYDRDAMPDHAFRSEEEAIDAWNTRAAPSTTEQVIRLRQALGWIGDAADAAYNEDPDNTRIHEIFNIVAQAVGITRRLPDEYQRFTEDSI